MKAIHQYYISSFMVSLLLPLAMAAASFSLLGIIFWLLPASIKSLLPQSASDLYTFIVAPSIALLSFGAGRLWARRSKLPDEFMPRMIPLVGPVVLALLSFAVYSLMAGPAAPLDPPLIMTIGPFSLFPVYCFYWLGFIYGGERTKRSRETAKGDLLMAAALIVCASGAVGAWFWSTRHLIINDGYYAYTNDPSTNMEYGLWMSDYLPFRSPSSLPKPASPPSLRLRENLPRLDGDRALLPLYGTVIEAVYDGLDELTAYDYFDQEYPAKPYQRLIDGDADLIFVAEMPDQFIKQVEDAGLKIKRTPIAQTALVFMLNKDNPVNGLSVKEIGGIYAGEMHNWQEVGGKKQRIMAFAAGSPSVEQAMNRLVRHGRPDAVNWIMQSRSHEGFSYQFQAVYRNHLGDLGYDFSGYADHEQFYSIENRKYLSVDGIPPTQENIESRRYPLTVNIEALTLNPPSSETQELLDWLTGPEGQELIRSAGIARLCWIADEKRGDE